VVSSVEARRYLEDLSKLWEETEPEGRRAMAEATFDRIDVLGMDLTLHPSAEANRYGWANAFGTDLLACTFSRSGRGERNSAVVSDAGAVVRFVRESRSEVKVRSA